MGNFDSVSGRELDALVAERVMGAEVARDRPDEDGAPRILVELSRYHDSPSSARGLSFFMEQRYPGFDYRVESAEPYVVVARGPSGREYRASGESEATAVCRAMLETVEGEGPGTPLKELRARHDERSKLRAMEMLANRAEMHQDVGLMAQVMLLHAGENKHGAARALLEVGVSTPQMVPVLAETLEGEANEIAGMCAMTLACIAKAGEAARQALNACEERGVAAMSEIIRNSLSQAQRLCGFEASE